MSTVRIAGKQLLARIGAGEPLESVLASTQMSRTDFDAWWSQQLVARIPREAGETLAPVTSTVSVGRDRLGIPHIFAANDHDLFVGFGYAVGIDRMFQLDYMRRRAHGRLSEILGKAGLELDSVARTLGLSQLAEAELAALPEEAATLLGYFAIGINVALESCRRRLPIEFDLLDYEPEPWRPVDSVAIVKEIRWYLTGRPEPLAIQELIKRGLGDQSLSDAALRASIDGGYPFIASDGSTDSFIPKASGPTLPSQGNELEGSNNWVVAGARAASGQPMMASDPHFVFAEGRQRILYQVHLCGGSFNVAGAGYVGVPGILFGRNPNLAWCITNNPISQRDLYLEQSAPDHVNEFLHDGEWQRANLREQTIDIRGEDPLRMSTTSTRHGPIINHLLPVPAREIGPVSIRWVGFEPCEFIAALERLNRARTVAEVRHAIRGWKCPAFNLMLADDQGHIAYQATGAVPIRRVLATGFRPGWQSNHEWGGYLALDEHPSSFDPDRGWLASSNNRPTDERSVSELSGKWDVGFRAKRIAQLIDATDHHTVRDFAAIQGDTVSVRARECIQHLLGVLDQEPDLKLKDAVAPLRHWDGNMGQNEVAPTIFENFFLKWRHRIAAERLPKSTSLLIDDALDVVAIRLLGENYLNWFATDNARRTVVLDCFGETLQELERTFGTDIERWIWGRHHVVILSHILANRGDLGMLLDGGRLEAGGSGTTISNFSAARRMEVPDEDSHPPHEVTSGVTYRMIADMGSDPPSLWSMALNGNSGWVGGRHYSDGLDDWKAGRYHELSIDPDQARKASPRVTTLITNKSKKAQ